MKEGTMKWNHRVIFHDNGPDNQWYGIHECFYDHPKDDVPTSWTTNPGVVVSDSTDGLFWVLECMRRAVEKATLVIDGDKLRERGSE